MKRILISRSAKAFLFLLPVCAACLSVNPLRAAFIINKTRNTGERGNILYTAGQHASSIPTCSAFEAASGTVISWGVNPNTREATPEPPKGSAEMLRQNNGVFVGKTNEKKVYFTFDLGYEAGHTAKVLDILKENGIKAIFFVCGNYLKEKELIGRMISEGHCMGNHTDRHKDLPTLSDEGIKKDIADLQEKFAGQYEGKPMKYFRPPQGRFDERTLREANTQGLKTVMWSIAIVDWGKTPIDTRANADKIEKRLHPGAILLSHITNSGTPEMLRLLLPKMAAKGYSAGNPVEL